MRNFKQTFWLLSIAIVAIALTSCSSGGKKNGEVKLIPVTTGNEYQYIDGEGKIVINPQFKEATIFRDGLALVKTSGDKPQWGFIGEDGKFVIAANYVSATVFSEDKAWVVSENSAPSCINTKGELMFTMQNAEEVRLYSEDLAAFKEVNKDGLEKWGFVAKDGKVKISVQFSNVGDFSNGRCAVSNNDGKWGYIDNEGKLIINYQFDYAESFLDEQAIVISGGKTGVIDDEGKFSINPQFSSMQNDGNLFLVEQDGKFGWTDKSGKIIINPQFSAAFPFSGGNLAAVQSGGKYGFIDKEGKIVINPQFDVALPFNGKLALVVSSDKIGFIDKEGKYAINPQFDAVTKDLVMYFQNGGTQYGSIQTDFFNIGAITSRIKIDAPEGLTLNSTMADVLKKLNKTEVDFGKYSEENVLIRNEKITNDASLTFYVSGNPWSPTDYYSSFRRDFKPTGFSYLIQLSRNGVGKEDAIITLIEQSLTGYSKDSTSSTGTSSVYKNDKQLVELYVTRNQDVVVNIKPLTESEENLPGQEGYAD